MPQSDEEKKAALQQRIAALREKVRRIERRENAQERRARAHRLVVSGAIVEEHALINPDDEFARAYGRLLAQRVEANDRPLFAELFRALLPAGEASALLSDETKALPAANLDDQLERLVEATKCSKSWLVNDTLRFYVANEQQSLTAVEEGKQALRDGKVVDHETVVAAFERIVKPHP